MAPDVAEVQRALLALAPDDRAAVIESGLVSLDDEGAPQHEIDAGWREVVAERVREIEAGEVKLVSASESEAQVAELLAQLRR